MLRTTVDIATAELDGLSACTNKLFSRMSPSGRQSSFKNAVVLASPAGIVLLAVRVCVCEQARLAALLLSTKPEALRALEEILARINMVC